MAILPVCTGVSSCARAKIVKKSRFEVFRDVIFPDFMHKAPTFLYICINTKISTYEKNFLSITSFSLMRNAHRM